MANSRLTAGCYRADSRLLCRRAVPTTVLGRRIGQEPRVASRPRLRSQSPRSMMTPYLHQSAMITQAKQPV
jgi:hypothetical protein